MWAKGHGLGSCSHLGKIGACCVTASWGGQRALSQKQGAELACGYTEEVEIQGQDKMGICGGWKGGRGSSTLPWGCHVSVQL